MCRSKKTAHAADHMSQRAHFHLRREKESKPKHFKFWSLILTAASSLGSFHYTPHLWLLRAQLPFVRTQRQKGHDLDVVGETEVKLGLTLSPSALCQVDANKRGGLTDFYLKVKMCLWCTVEKDMPHLYSTWCSWKIKTHCNSQCTIHVCISCQIQGRNQNNKVAPYVTSALCMLLCDSYMI